MTTPVRIPEADPRDMRVACRVLGEELFSHDGGLWRALRGAAGAPIPGAAVLEWLGSGTASPAAEALAAAFRRGPVLGAPLRGRASRGEEGAGRHAPQDLGEAESTRSRLVAHLGAGLVLAGGAAFLRCHPFACRTRTGTALHLSVSHWEATGFTRLSGGRPGDAVAYAFRAEGLGIPDALVGEGDVLAMANALPELVHEEARAILSAHARTPVGGAEAARLVAERAAALLPAAAAGTVGGIGLPEAGAVLERCLALSRAIQGFGGPLWSVEHLPRLDEYLSGHALPRCGGADSESDLASIASLCP
jgi:hypothetical protein